MFKNTKVQNNMIFTLATALVSAGILANTGVVAVAMIVGFILSMLVGYFHKVKSSDFDSVPTWKMLLVDAVLALVGSQVGWSALCI
jgi:hypothetical protein